MTGRCCKGEGRSCRLARRVSGPAAAVFPTAILVLLPKCPLCLAAWLTVATGVGVSTLAASWVREGIVVVCLAALGLAAAQLARWRFSAAKPGASS